MQQRSVRELTLDSDINARPIIADATGSVASILLETLGHGSIREGTCDGAISCTLLGGRDGRVSRSPRTAQQPASAELMTGLP